MSKSLRLSLRPGQRIYINGAELRVDRKVSLELMSPASFLLDEHVIDPQSATTPLRRLYCAIQASLIGHGQSSTAQSACRMLLTELREAAPCEQMRAGIEQVDACVEAGRLYQALRKLRGLFPLEDAEHTPVDP